MTDHTKTKIANAFYSNPRKMFLPLTSDDIMRRSKLRADVCDNAHISMMYDGLIVATRAKDFAAYELTELGRALVEVAK